MLKSTPRSLIALVMLCAGLWLTMQGAAFAAIPVNVQTVEAARSEIADPVGAIVDSHEGNIDTTPYDVDANPCANDRWHSPSATSFTFDSGALHESQPFSLTKTTDRPLIYTKNEISSRTPLPSWLKISMPAKGISGTFSVEIDATGLADGTYYARPLLLLSWEDTEETFCGFDTLIDGRYWYKIGDPFYLDIELIVGECSPTIREIDSSPKINAMGRRYSLTSEIKLPAACPGEREVTVKAGEVSWGSLQDTDVVLGDSLRDPLRSSEGGSQIVLTLKPGEPQTVTFESSHQFDWLEGYPHYSACMFGGRLQVGRLDLPWTSEEIYDHLDRVAMAHSPGSLVTWRKYGFYIDATVKDGPSIRRQISHDDERAPLVRPDLAAVIAANFSVARGHTAVMSNVIDYARDGTSNYPGLGMVGTMEFIASCSRPWWSIGAAGASTSRALGMDIPPSLAGAPASAAKEYAIALFTTYALFRQVVDLEQQAFEAGAGNNEELLEQAAEMQQQYEEALAAQGPLYDAYIAEVDASGLTFDILDLMAIQEELETNGLPAIQQQILKEVGFSQEEIDKITDAFIEKVLYVEEDWKEELRLLSGWQTQLGTLTSEYIEELRNEGGGSGDSWMQYLPTVTK